MVNFLKGRRRTDDDSLVSTESAAESAASAALNALVCRAEAAVEQLLALAPMLDRSAELDALREHSDAAAGLTVRLAATEEQADRVAATQTRTEAQLCEAGENVAQLQSRMGDLSAKAESALALGDQLAVFLGSTTPMTALRNDADLLRAQLAELTEQVGRMRGQADDALHAHRHATARLESLDDERQAAAGRLDEVARRVQGIERSLEPVTQAVAAVPDLQHRLNVFKALAEQVGQKVGMLEQQREAVERAATQISQLTRLDRELDAWLRRQEEQTRRFNAIEARIAEVNEAQAKVLARSEELQALSQETESTQQAARQALTELREQMRKSSEGFELENRGLHAVSERVADLRNAVKDCEARFATLDAASQGAAAVQAQVRTLGTDAKELSAELSRLSAQARQVAVMRDDVERLEAAAGELGGRMERIDALKPDVAEAMQHLAALSGSREMMADGLERMAVAYDEMTRLRETHTEAQAALAKADQWVRAVQGEVRELSDLRPSVEQARAAVDQVQAAVTEVESRRGLVDEVRRQLAELGTLSGELTNRTEGLRARMDNAESRFAQLGRQAEQAERVSSTVAAVETSVGHAEERLGAVDGSVRALESRTSQLDILEERIRVLGQELEQRQGALDKASEHLTQASALRTESAETAQRLEEVTRVVGGTLRKAEQQVAGLQRVSAELEARAAALSSVEGRVVRFEELLATWESAQGEAAKGLEQTLARQGAVDALDAQVKHVFGLAERAVEDVRMVGAARREVEDTRVLLQETQVQFTATAEALKGFDARKRQLERAEERLGRAEALAIGVRSAVESLQAQRTMVDHAVESSATLAFRMKQAEALIDALRRERMLACDLKAALATVGEPDEDVAEATTDRG